MHPQGRGESNDPEIGKARLVSKELPQGVSHVLRVDPSPALQPVETARPASSRHTFSLLTAALAGAAAADVAITTSCVSSGRCVEANPTYRGVASSRWQMGAIKAAGTGSLALAAWKLRREHPKAATWMLVSLVAGQSGIVLWNAHQVTR